MHGNDANILELSDKIKAFMRKIFLWRLDISDNCGHEYCPSLDRILADFNITSVPSVVVKTASSHLSTLEGHF